MPHRTSLAYRILARTAVAAVPLVAPFNAKIGAGHRGRAGAAERLKTWAAAHRDRNRPLLWVHASSVGEGLQAIAVLGRLRACHPDWQVLYTHFSPSAERLAGNAPADCADYLPYDLPGTVDSVLTALEPSALVFSKLDLWPELATRAAARGTAVAIIAATVSPVSGRIRWPERTLTHPGYATVRAAGAIAAEDAGRLALLGVPASRIEVLGDPRFDSVAETVAAVSPEEPLLAWGRGAPTLVAGSTWPFDEAVLLEAFAAVHRTHPAARLILAPHEPTEAHLTGVERKAARFGVPAPVRMGRATDPEPFLLVDRVGVLARIYGGGAVAYVGGGFGQAGLHSALEPAAWGLPVVFGPWWSNSREAGLLLEAGAAVALPPRSHAPASRLTALWRSWLADKAARRRAGAAALAVVKAGLGAADRQAAMVERLLRTQ
ncbi:MAG TPA: glycosyltransferase N-terminal domain-containing protein [Gemmatimonadales bacterium]